MGVTMPIQYAIKCTTGNFICGSQSAKVERDDDGLVPLQWAQLYPIKGGAERAMRSTGDLLNHHRETQTELAHRGYPEYTAKPPLEFEIVEIEVRLKS